MQNLPTDVFNIILKLLDTSNLDNLRLVCNRFNSIINNNANYWREKCLSGESERFSIFSSQSNTVDIIVGKTHIRLYQSEEEPYSDYEYDSHGNYLCYEDYKDRQYQRSILMDRVGDFKRQLSKNIYGFPEGILRTTHGTLAIYVHHEFIKIQHKHNDYDEFYFKTKVKNTDKNMAEIKNFCEL